MWKSKRQLRGTTQLAAGDEKLVKRMFREKDFLLEEYLQPVKRAKDWMETGLVWCYKQTCVHAEITYDQYSSLVIYDQPNKRPLSKKNASKLLTPQEIQNEMAQWCL